MRPVNSKNIYPSGERYAGKRADKARQIFLLHVECPGPQPANIIGVGQNDCKLIVKLKLILKLSGGGAIARFLTPWLRAWEWSSCFHALCDMCLFESVHLTPSEHFIHTWLLRFDNRTARCFINLAKRCLKRCCFAVHSDRCARLLLQVRSQVLRFGGVK